MARQYFIETGMNSMTFVSKSSPSVCHDIAGRGVKRIDIWNAEWDRTDEKHFPGTSGIKDDSFDAMRDAGKIFHIPCLAQLMFTVCVGPYHTY